MGAGIPQPYLQWKTAQIAQLVEQRTENPRVAGSIPALGTICGYPLGAPHAGIAHLVERHLAKVEVASSSLVARSSSGIPLTAARSASGGTLRRTGNSFAFSREPLCWVHG